MPKRSPVPKPTRVHRDRKKEESRTACRGRVEKEEMLVYLFTTKECEIGGVCQKWIPLLKNMFGARLVVIYVMLVPMEHREAASEAMAVRVSSGGNPNDMPWAYDAEKMRIATATEGGEGVVWE